MWKYEWIFLLFSSSSDFGMMGEFRQELRDGFVEACLHLVNRDFDALAKDFVTLGYATQLLLIVIVELLDTWKG